MKVKKMLRLPLLPNWFARRHAIALLSVGLLVLGFAFGSRNVRADTASTGMRTVTQAEAAGILGGAFPDVAYKPLGLHRSSILANPLSMPQNVINVGYAIREPRAVVQLSVLKSPSITQVDDGVVETNLGGHQMQVLTKSGNNARDGTWTFLVYTWSARGLSFSLTVHLLDGLDRADADKIAASTL
jgi:hypothetical protein